MLLSFSVPEMLPYVCAGIRQAQGEDVGIERTKRQTIRHRGPRAEMLLKQVILRTKHLGTLHLWWKSRTPAREFLGKIEGFQLVPIEIWHRTNGQCDIRSSEFANVSWNPDGNEHGPTFDQFAKADGFDGAQSFRDYFVPDAGDVFSGVLFKW